MQISMSGSNLLDTIRENGNSYVRVTSKGVMSQNDKNVKAREEAGDLRKAIRELKNCEDSAYSEAKMEKKLKSFVTNYNELQKKSKDTDTKNFKKTMKALEEMISDNERQLKKVGIFKAGEKLQFSKSTFESADKRHIEKLCSGKDSFAAESFKLINKAYKQIGNELCTPVSKTKYEKYNYSSDEIAVSSNALHINDTLSILRRYCEDSQKYSDQDFTGNFDFFISLFVQEGYNRLQKGSSVETDTDYIEKIKNLSERTDIKDMLAKVGVTFDDAGQMVHSSEMMKNDDYGENVLALFKKGAEYAATLMSYNNNLIDSILRTNEINVTIDTYV